MTTPSSTGAPPSGERRTDLLALEGVMAALLTPLDGAGALDLGALDRLLAHILAHPVSGICPAGSTGEGPLLSRDQRAQLVAAVVDRVGARAAVIPAAVSTSVRDVLTDLDAYGDSGADAVLVTPPYYYPATAATLRRFYETVAARSPLPVVIYNIPSMTKVSVPPEVVGELAGHERVVGMKDSSRDFEYFERVLSATGGHHFSLMTGSDTLLLASVVLGGSGTIAASVNVVPELVVSLLAAAREGHWARARSLQQRLLEVVSACRRPGSPGGWKAAASLLGLCGPEAAPPLQPPGEELRARLGEELGALGVLAGGPLQTPGAAAAAPAGVAAGRAR